MQTITEQLEIMATKVSQLLEDLYLNHSSIYLWNEPGSGFISGGGNYGFHDLDDQGRQLQSMLLDEYRKFYNLLSILIKDCSEDTRADLQKYNSTVLERIEQDHTWLKTIDETLNEGKDAIFAETALLKRLYDVTDGTVIIVPDTNALISNPALEDWSFGDFSTYTLLLLPIVLSELDELKINHKNETVRDKAKILINKIKEYRRRGRLTEGVVLVKGISKLISVAVEPKFENTLPWLTPRNNDDIFLCAFIEVMRSYPRSPVVIITSDINLQNKAEFARLSFIEPPEKKEAQLSQNP